MARNIEAAKCVQCGKLHYPTHFYCPSCKGTKFQGVAIEGEGTLVTWTRSHVLPLDYSTMYITLGIVQMDMGVKVMGQLDVGTPQTGMRLRSRIGKVREIQGSDIKGLVFTAI
ncbi:MAG: OB-fold domain-containing protein [Candidatus Riflebacteria bacterium]|nr:OB-fold domain-containing protein [Candidatus Riflebacteria bacterium]